MKVLWYVSHVISEDEDVQKLGVVNVVYNVGGGVEQCFDFEKSRRVSRIFRAKTLRFASFFVCLDEGAWMTVVDAFSFMISKYLRVRLRIILGDHVESQEKLKAVGVPSSVLPIDNPKINFSWMRMPWHLPSPFISIGETCIPTLTKLKPLASNVR